MSNKMTKLKKDWDLIEDATWYLDGKEISYDSESNPPGVIRDRYYEVIDELVEAGDYSKNPMHDPVSPGSRNFPVRDSSEDEKEYEAWKRFAHWVDAKLEVDYEDGSTKTYSVEPRGNFNLDSVAVSPSIMRLENEEGDQVGVVREMRNYDADYILPKLQNIESGFKRNSHDDLAYDLFNRGSTPSRESFDEEKFLMVPELYLETVNHMDGGLYDQIEMESFEGSYVTPPRQILVGMEDERAFTLRPFMQNYFDQRSVDSAEELANHFGTLFGLGLMTRFDREDEFTKPKGIDAATNFDPEFWAFSSNEGHLEGEDWNQARKMLEREANLTDEEIDEVKSKANDIKKQIDTDFIDLFPDEVNEDLWPEEKKIESLK